MTENDTEIVYVWMDIMLDWGHTHLDKRKLGNGIFKRYLPAREGNGDCAERVLSITAADIFFFRRLIVHIAIISKESNQAMPIL